MKKFLSNLKLIIKSTWNIIRILLKMDSNNQQEVWEATGNQTGLPPAQIDGFAKYKELEPILNKQKLFLVESLTSHMKSGSILDYGCGTGRYLELLEREKKYDLFGIDQSLSILKNYTQKRNLKSN